MINDDFLDELAADLDLDVLAELLTEKSEDQGDEYIPKCNSTSGALSFQQHRLWLQQQVDVNASAYNIPRAYEIRNDIDLPRLEHALNLVISNHCILRTIYRGSSEPEQIVLDKQPVTIEGLTLYGDIHILVLHSRFGSTGRAGVPCLLRFRGGQS